MKLLHVPEKSRANDYDKLFAQIADIRDPQELLTRVAQGLQRDTAPRANVRLSTDGLPDGSYQITRLYTHDGTEHVDGGSWGDSNNVLPVYTNGILGQLISTDAAGVYHDLSLYNDLAVGDILAPYRSAMVMRIHSTTHPGNWMIILGCERDEYSIEELADAIQRTNLIGMALDNLHMSNELEQASKWIQREVDTIGEIQRVLLPESLPDINGLKLGAFHTAYDRAGGDYHDIFVRRSATDSESPDGLCTVIVADAVGHGPASTVIMTIVNLCFHTICKSVSDPAKIAQYINGELCARRLPTMMVTAWIGSYDPNTGQGQYASAGHDEAIVLKEGTKETIALPGGDGIPLGIFDDIEYESYHFSLNRNDTLVIYTDGIAEALAPTGERFGLERVHEVIRLVPPNPQDVANTIRSAVRAFESGLEPQDDQTVMVLRHA